MSKKLYTYLTLCSSYFSTSPNYSSGSAFRTTVNSGGRMDVICGTATSTIINDGHMGVLYGATVTSTTINSGGMFIYDGASVYRTTVNSGHIDVWLGTVTSTTINSGGSMTVGSGSAYRTTVNSGCYMDVGDGTTVTSTTINSGGSMRVSSDSNAFSTTVSRGGVVYFDKRYYNSSTSSIDVTLKNGASIGLGGGFLLGTQSLANRGLILNGRANNLTSMTTNAKTNIVYDVSTLSACIASSWKDTMLRTSLQKAYAGKYTVVTAVDQQLGTYALSDNISLADGKAFTIKQDSSTIGTVKLNGDSLSKNGLKYTVTKQDNATQRISLTIDLKAGKMLKGTTENNKLTGNTHCDIFYGGKGNDTITGKNGRDVAVYDTTDWGKDVIKKTNGNMTILFKDIENVDIHTSLEKGIMTITRDGTDQQITVNGWNDETHKIVYGGTATMTAFDTYLSQASPSNAQIAAARNEVWQKAGLAASA